MSKPLSHESRIARMARHAQRREEMATRNEPRAAPLDSLRNVYTTALDEEPRKAVEVMEGPYLETDDENEQGGDA